MTLSDAASAAGGLHPFQRSGVAAADLEFFAAARFPHCKGRANRPLLEDIRRTLWATADKLRANMDAAEYKHLELGLNFVKYISDTFQARRSELTARLADPGDDYFLEDSTPKALAAELADRDYHREVNVFWVPESAR